MKTIEVSDETYKFLMDLSKELTTQNHRGTAMPYFFQIKTQEAVGCSRILRNAMLGVRRMQN